ncbi:MAG TPA: sugar ABC transporter permease [Verrucomicrobiae bacterium]|nr:sugar ABC transporter permease [Verrucomicrobiae bacterium]
MLAPLAVGTLVLVVLPAFATLALAFMHYDALGAPAWAGLENLRQLARDPVFLIALENSITVALVAVPLRIALALGLALLLHAPRRETPALRTAVYLPTAVPDLAWALLWLWLLNPLYGPAAWLLPALGVRADIWLTDPAWARGAIVTMLLFGVGEMMLVLLAARREVPVELYELGAVEGASKLTLFRQLTLPLLWPALLFLACRDAALTLQTSFVPGLIVTNGGPNYATTFLPLTIWQNGFEYLRFGYAAAQTLAMFLLTLLMMTVQIVALRRWARSGA